MFSYLLQANLFLAVFFLVYYGCCTTSSSQRTRRMLLWGIGLGALLLPLLPIPQNNKKKCLEIDEQLRRMNIPASNGSADTTTDLLAYFPDLFSRENLTAIYLFVAALLAIREKVRSSAYRQKGITHI